MKKQLSIVKAVLLCLFACFAGTGFSFGQILSYTSATDGSLSSVASNATGTALSRVNGANIPGSPCGSGFSSKNFSSTTTYSSSLAAVEVTVTPATSYALHVTSFSAGIRRSSTGPAMARFAYSTNGGSTWTDQGTNQSPNNASCGSMTTPTWTTTVTVTAPNTLKFRVYVFDASSTAGTFQIMNLTVNGTVSLTCTPPSLSTSVTNVSCNGGNNGAIDLTVSGGSSPYTYSWTNSATTQDISGLTANTYSVTVTGNDGCVARTSATVTQPSAVIASIASHLNASCATYDGEATATATGGTAGYTYLWSTSQAGATATGLAYGVYTVTATDAHSCTGSTTASISRLDMIGLSATSITSGSATLNWTDTGASDSYNIRYRQTGAGSWTTSTATITSLPVSGLTSGTTYEFQVQPVCTGGTTGSFSASTNFTTSGTSPCGTPGGLSTTSITATGATLNWGSVSGAVSYNIQYRVTGGSTWTSTTSSTTSIAVSGLASATAYEFQVQTACSGSTSSFSTSGNFTTTSASDCDASLWDHVYNSYRLAVNQSCITITGTVANKINEADGDIHIRVTVDPAYSYMINSSNVSGQHGDLVCEPLCTHTVTQSDAIASCAGYTNTVYIPNVGEHVAVTGSYVTDNNHGWNEIHPVTSITIVGAKHSTTNPKAQPTSVLAAEDVKVYPNPAGSDLFFKLEKKPSSVVYITVVDGIGRLAGQFQMLETQELDMRTFFLPNGTYYYSVSQNNKVVKGGKVVIDNHAQ